MAAAATAPFADLEAIVGTGGLVVLAPHPDDESLGCGALLRTAALARRRVTVIVVTDGCLSHPASPSMNAAALADLRAREVRAALRALHPDIELRELGYRDCDAPDAPPEVHAAASVIVEAVDAIHATALIGPWDGDPHKDHVATAGIARRVLALRPALRFWSYPIWGRFAPGSGPVPQQLVRFDAGPNRAAKTAAIACHQSQMTRLIDDDPNGFLMSTGMQHHFIAHPEVYLADA